MIRFATLPGMYERTISIGSAGKAFSITGWKVGWSIAPKEILNPLKMVHQNCSYTCSTPTQEAVAVAFEKELELNCSFTCSTPTQEAVAVAFEKEFELFSIHPEQSYLLTELPNELREKCDRLYKMLSEAGFDPIRPDAGYFMIAHFGTIDGPFRYDASGDEPLDFRFVRWLCKEMKLATIPVSAFYDKENRVGNEDTVRFCFLKTDDTLQAVHEMLKNLRRACRAFPHF
ncbi:unnamed protein product [Cylicostephanus goldi]|uniref:kynurenine--oxoglutarate transaminase n=1 Tax=Cylicostephanus goldi TaxID=71465 RepID=A0A3P7N3D0_CYLGO|nr:unnamed protein product [Cylicostephanus goldi]